MSNKNPKIKIIIMSMIFITVVVLVISLILYFTTLKKTNSIENNPSPALETNSTPALQTQDAIIIFSKGSSSGILGGAGGIILNLPNISIPYGQRGDSGFGGKGYGSGGGSSCTTYGGNGAQGFVYLFEDKKLFTETTTTSYKATRTGSHTFVLMGGGGGGGCNSGGDSGELIIYKFPIIGKGWSINITVGLGGTLLKEGGDSIINFTDSTSTTSIVARGAKPANTINFPEVFGVFPYDYTKDQAPGICAQYGADVATYDQLVDAQKRGADWCSTGWLDDTPDAYYPITIKTYQGCGNGSQGIMSYTPGDKAGVNCYGVKPRPDTNNKIFPFQVKNNDIYYYQPYDSEINLYEIPRQDYVPISLGGLKEKKATEIEQTIIDNLNATQPININSTTTAIPKPFLNPTVPISKDIITTSQYYYLKSKLLGFTKLKTDETDINKINKFLLSQHYLSNRSATTKFAKFKLNSTQTTIYNNNIISLTLSDKTNFIISLADNTFPQNTIVLTDVNVNTSNPIINTQFTIKKVDDSGNFIVDQLSLKINDYFLLIMNDMMLLPNANLQGFSTVSYVLKSIKDAKDQGQYQEGIFKFEVDTISTDPPPSVNLPPTTVTPVTFSNVGLNPTY